MGIDYAFRLFFEDEQARDVLGAVANLAFETSGEFSTVSFADGESLNVPFTVKFKNALVSLAEPEAVVSLDTSLWFATDDLIDDFVVECGEHGQKMRDGDRVRIGYIYLNINRWNTGLVEFEFTAATSSMSRLFESSASIRSVFIGLLQAHDGVCGVFDNENEETYGLGYLIWPQEPEDKAAGIVLRDQLIRLDSAPQRGS